MTQSCDHLYTSVLWFMTHSLMILSVPPIQFLCLKNIRTFLAACSDTFGMKKSELFEAFDLFDVRDFGKVRHRDVEKALGCLFAICP